MIKVNQNNIKKLFDNLEKENNIEMIEQIILTLKSKEIYDMTPKKVKSGSFIKKALEEKIIITKDLVEKEKEQITKDYYLELVKINRDNSLDSEMWKDKDTIIKIIKANPALIKEIIKTEKLTIEEDLDKIMGLFYESDDISLAIMSRNINKTVVQKIEKKDPELIIRILKREDKAYDMLSEESKKEPKYVKAVLSNEHTNGYYIVKDELKKIRDKDISIMALEKSSDAIKYIYQPYQKILRDNSVKKDYANFLKIYWLHKEMKKEQYKENNISKEIIKKNKI